MKKFIVNISNTYTIETANARYANALCDLASKKGLNYSMRVTINGLIPC